MTPFRAIAISAVLLPLFSCTSKETDRRLFRKMDDNRDNRLSLAEVNKEGLPRIFNLFDLNGDGSVTLAEARKVDATFSSAQFAKRDTNRDGSVSYAEYEKHALKQGGLRSDFAKVDRNGDGFIDKAEASAHVAETETRLAAKN